MSPWYWLAAVATGTFVVTSVTALAMAWSLWRER